MQRRDLMKSLGMSALFSSTAKLAAAPKGRATTSGQTNTRVGSVDLAEFDVIDVHVHQPMDKSDAEEEVTWNAAFVDALLPSAGTPGRDVLRSRLLREFGQHFARMPREIGMRNYVAKVYGVPATAEGFDSVVAPHIGKDYSAYYGAVMDRERIPKILLQSDDLEPVRPKSLVPDDRFVWSYNVGPLIQPDWARAQSAHNLREFEAALHRTLEKCKENGARGIKIPIAYYRPIVISSVTAQQAQRDFESVRAVPAPRYGENLAKNPEFDKPELNQALRSYQDYLLKSMYVKCGQLGLRVIIHTAVALHPALRFDFNDPTGMYNVFQDVDVKRAGTQFVLIHTGYPRHPEVAAMLSQFPNVFVDLSFYSNFPGVLEETMRAFLALAPSEKIMHGSDWSTPETLGYCAYNLRNVLARILNDYRDVYGWSEHDCETMARNVMSENARRVYDIGR